MSRPSYIPKLNRNRLPCEEQSEGTRSRGERGDSHTSPSRVPRCPHDTTRRTSGAALGEIHLMPFNHLEESDGTITQNHILTLSAQHTNPRLPLHNSTKMKTLVLQAPPNMCPANSFPKLNRLPCEKQDEGTPSPGGRETTVAPLLLGCQNAHTTRREGPAELPRKGII